MTILRNKQDAARQDAVLQQEQAQGNEAAAIKQVTTDPEIQMLQELLSENKDDFEITEEVMERIMKKQEEIHQMQGDAIFRIVNFMHDRQRKMEQKLDRMEDMILQIWERDSPSSKIRISENGAVTVTR